MNIHPHRTIPNSPAIPMRPASVPTWSNARSAGEGLPAGERAQTQTCGTTPDLPNRNLRAMNIIATHFCAAGADELARIRQDIQIRLEPILLFRHAARPEELGIETERYDAAFNRDPDGLKKEWQAWKTEVIDRAALAYGSLKDNEAVFMTLWHPNMYGGDVTHVSAIMIGKTDDGPAVDIFHNEHHHPEVDMVHHESVPVKADKSYDDGRLPRALGLRYEDYDTSALFAMVGGKPVRHAELPAVQSISLGGLPSVNFLVARDFKAGAEYAQQCREFAMKHHTGLVYAPFGSKNGTPPQASYPSPMPHAVAPADMQINTCYSSTVDLAVAAKVDGYDKLSHASLPEQGEQMRAIGMLSNTGKPQMLGPSVRGFKAYATEAGVNPEATPTDKKPVFDIQGGLLKRMEESGISLREYRVLMKEVPQFLRSVGKPAPGKL